MNWVVAVVIAGICAAAEAWLSGPKPFAVLESLRQPRWAFPAWGWMIVGAAFYIIFVFALGRMLALGTPGYGAVLLIILVLLTDGFWNFLLFRKRRFDWAYLYLFPYTVLVVASCWLCWTLDAWAGLAILPYIVFLPYDFAWTKTLANLNPSQDLPH